MSQLESTKKLHNEGKYEAAIKGYQEILAKEPNNDEAHFGLAYASSQTNLLEQALKHAKLAVNLVPNSDRYLQFKGQMLMANQQLDDALKTFKRSIKENPNLFYSYVAVGDIYTVKNETKKAKEYYQLALKVHQNGLPAIIKLSRLYIFEGDIEAAEHLLQEAELQFSDNSELKIQLGLMRLEQDEQGFAELHFKKLLEDEPNNHVAKTYLAMSVLQSNSEHSKQLITELLNNKVKRPEVMAAVGMFYHSIGKYQEAINYLSPVSQTGLAYPSWMLTLAQAYAANQQTQSAMNVLTEVLERGESSKAQLMLGQIHQRNNKPSTAIKCYQNVKQDDKYFSQALMLQAECHFINGDYTAVINQLEPLLKERADHSAALKLKLKALSQLGQYDEALALIDAIDDKKHSAEFNQMMHLYAGLLLDETQKYDQAWQHFTQIEPHKATEIELLSQADEKWVQNLPQQSGETDSNGSHLRFVFTDPATGYYDLINWLAENDFTPLLDRFKNNNRNDVFTTQWSIKLLADLSDVKVHFLRKKYLQKLNQTISDTKQTVVDFLPISPINAAIIKRIFPQAQVLLLSRNFADLRLHNRVFGSHQVDYLQFSKIANQMVAMNSKVSLVDLDAWQKQDEMAQMNIEKVFGSAVTAFNKTETKPLDRLMFPYMHWKNYQKQLNMQNSSSQKPNK